MINLFLMWLFLSQNNISQVTTQKLDPPPIDFALTPYRDYCGAPSPCFPHPPYGAWIGNGLCLPDVKTDFLGVPRPNRTPGTLFPGDTGCDIGAFQFVQNGLPIVIPYQPRNLTIK